MANQQNGQRFIGPGNASSSTVPFIEIFRNRAPQTTDINYTVGQRWFDLSENQEYLLIGFTSAFDTNQNQTVLSATWVTGIAINSGVVAFSAGANTSGVFPVTSDGTGKVSTGSTSNTVQVTGLSHGLDFNLVATTIASGTTTTSIGSSSTGNVTSVVLTAGTWLVHGWGTVNSAGIHEMSISATSATINTDNYIAISTSTVVCAIFPFLTTSSGSKTIYLTAQNTLGSPQNATGALLAQKIGQ